MRDDDTITRAELVTALFRLNNSTSWITADELFKSAEALREPEWQADDVVRDANGVVWQKSLHTAMWRKPGSVDFHGDSALKRPLKRMVEEDG